MKPSALLSLLPLALLACVAPARGGDSSVSKLSCCTLAEVDQAPRAVKQTAPLYPVELKNAKMSGEALVSFVVDETGRTRDVACLQQNQPGFAEAAVTAVKQWRFEAARKGNQPVACRMNVPIVFSLAP